MATRRASAIDASGMGIVVVVWGLNYLFVREGLSLTGPVWLAALRASVGAAGLLGAVVLLRRFSGVRSRDVRDAILIGLPNTAAFFGLWFVAERSVPPGTTAILVYTFPLFVTAFAPIILRTPWPGPKKLLPIGLGFAGVALVSQPWLSGGGAIAPVPTAELLLAAASWALGTVLFKRRFTGVAVLPANAIQLGGGAVALAIVAFVTETGLPPHASPALLVTVAWLGLLGTAVAYAIWFALLDRNRAETLSAYTFLVPLVALGASVAFLGEQIDLDEAAGIVLVVVALSLNRGSTVVPEGPARGRSEVASAP